MKTFRTSSRARAIAVAGLVVVGGGLSYALLTRNPEGNATAIAGARFIPEDAVFALSASTDSGRWQRLQRYGTPESQEPFDRVLDRLQANVLPDGDLNYNDDVRPWVGDRVSVAVLPPPPIAEDTPPEALEADRAFLFVLPIANPRRAQQALSAADDGGSWEELTYRGVTVRQRNDEGSRYAVAAVDRRVLLVSDEASAINRAIDTYKGEPSLLSVPGYDRAWDTLNASDPFASLFFNVPGGLQALAESSTRATDAEAIAELENQGIATTIDLENDGIRFRSLSWLAPKSETVFDAEANTPPTTIDRLPDSTALAIAGSDLDRLWNDYLDTAQANPLLPLDAAWFRSALQQTVNIDLEDELLSWMTGEFALAVVPAPAGEDAPFPGALVVLAEAGNRDVAMDFFEKLDRAVVDRYDFQVDVNDEAERPFVRWDTRRKGLDVTHGWLSGGVAFFSVGFPIAGELIPPPENPLSSSAAFERVVPRSPDPSNGVFFFNLQPGEDSERPSLPLLQLPPEQQAVLGAIEAIGVRAGIHDERSSRYDIFVKIP